MFQVGNHTLYPRGNRYQVGKVCKIQDNTKSIKTYILVSIKKALSILDFIFTLLIQK